MMGTLFKRAITSEYLAFVLRIYIGYFFIYASMSKIPYPAQFAEATANYRIVPYWMLNPSAVFLPWVEFVSGLFLMIGFLSRSASVVIGGMLVMFNVMVAINMYWGAPISCGCYDTVGEPIGWKKLIENFFMMISLVQVYYYDRLFIFHRGGLITTVKNRVTSSATSR